MGEALLRKGFGIPSENGELLLAGKPRAQNRWVEQMETRRENRRGLNKKRYPNDIRDYGQTRKVRRNKVKQGEMICKWFIITCLRGYFTLFHYFTLKSKVWVAYPYGMGYRKKANSRILFGIINKHTRGKIGIEKIGKDSTRN